MEEIKEIILSHCKGIAYPEFELEDLNVMVKEINDHYTNVKSQELTKAKEEVESLKKLLSENITDANDQRHNFVMAEIKVKSQAKEIEGLREFKNRVFVFMDGLFDDYHDQNWPEIREGLKILLKGTTQPDKGGE